VFYVQNDNGSRYVQLVNRALPREAAETLGARLNVSRTYPRSPPLFPPRRRPAPRPGDRRQARSIVVCARLRRGLDRGCASFCAVCVPVMAAPRLSVAPEAPQGSSSRAPVGPQLVPGLIFDLFAEGSSISEAPEQAAPRLVSASAIFSPQSLPLGQLSHLHSARDLSSTSSGGWLLPLLRR